MEVMDVNNYWILLFALAINSDQVDVVYDGWIDYLFSIEGIKVWVFLYGCIL